MWQQHRDLQAATSRSVQLQRLLPQLGCCVQRCERRRVWCERI
jgi:hypothetical protein